MSRKLNRQLKVEANVRIAFYAIIACHQPAQSWDPASKFYASCTVFAKLYIIKIVTMTNMNSAQQNELKQERLETVPHNNL